MSADFLANSGVRRRRRGYQPMSEINVTPFVDVMLVLLIVFMITAPLLTAGVPVDLPESQAEALDAEIEPITISVTQSGNVYVQDIEIELAQLGEKLFAIGDSNRDVQIYVRGDRAATYQDIVRVIGHIKASGFNRIGLVALDGSE